MNDMAAELRREENGEGGQGRFYKMSAVDGSIANDDDLLGSYPPGPPLAC